MDSVGDVFTLHLLDSDVSTHTFYVLSQSASGNFVYQQVDLNIECTTYSQTLAPVTAGSDLLEKDKNQGVVTLISDAELLALFSRSDSARCPITSFTLYATDDTLIESGEQHTLLDLSNRASALAAVNINTDIASAADLADTVITLDSSFKIKATALGGAVSWKQIDSSIVVCRNEVISLVDAATLTHSQAINPSAVATTFDLLSMFLSSDPYCLPKTFALKTTTGAPASATDPTAAELANFFIASGTPTVMSLFPQDEGVKTFYILA